MTGEPVQVTSLSLRLSLIAAAALVAACSPDDPDLMNFAASKTGPDEFLVAPANPLETPPDPKALPVPTLGSVNRADPTPIEDAVVALGGSAAALNREGVPSSDAGLVRHAGRYGTDPAIRGKLAEEDLEHRRANDGRFLERTFNVNVYYDAYEDQQLDQQAEIDRFRRAGIEVPSAPPKELKPR